MSVVVIIVVIVVIIAVSIVVVLLLACCCFSVVLLLLHCCFMVVGLLSDCLLYGFFNHRSQVAAAATRSLLRGPFWPWRSTEPGPLHNGACPNLP